MFNSTVLDVAFGLALTYFLLSALCSTIRELIARVLRERERGLVSGVHRLLGAPVPGRATLDEQTLSDAARTGQALVTSGADLAARTLAHPLLRGMTMKDSRSPTYIPAHGFALALVDVLSPAGKTQTTIDDLRAAIMKIDDRALRQVLLPLVDAAGADVASVRATIERRFDDVMDRVSGWYKRRTQTWILVTAIVAATVGNVDTIAIASTLYREPTVRAHMIASVAAEPPRLDTAGSYDAYKASSERLQSLDLPLGWTAARVPAWGAGALWKVLGIVLTVLALMLGTPFWFDVLSRIANLRAAGPKPPQGAPPGGPRDGSLLGPSSSAVATVVVDPQRDERDEEAAQ